MAYENGVGDVVDPLGGSYYVESLTSQLEQQAFEYIEKIDAQGGAVSALENGYQIREIQDAAFTHQQEVEQGEQVIVGVNRFVTDSPPIEGLLKVDEASSRQQVERLQTLRRERDNEVATLALKRLEDVARGSDNTMPAILECVENYCTIGEVCDVFREVFGEQEEFVAF